MHVLQFDNQVFHVLCTVRLWT